MSSVLERGVFVFSFALGKREMDIRLMVQFWYWIGDIWIVEKYILTWTHDHDLLKSNGEEKHPCHPIGKNQFSKTKTIE